jgi:hypothetical protein
MRPAEFESELVFCTLASLSLSLSCIWRHLGHLSAAIRVHVFQDPFSLLRLPSGPYFTPAEVYAERHAVSEASVPHVVHLYR